MIVGSAQKSPAEVITRVIDFSNDLASGETITSISSIVVLDQNGNDVTSTIYVSASGVIQPGGTNVQFQMQAGSLGQTYILTVTVESSAANVFQATVTLYVGLGIDLTTLANVKNWVGIPYLETSEDQTIQGCITAFSAYVLRVTGRGPEDGTVAAVSPFVSPVPYDDVYDGSGTLRQPIRNWPITGVTSVNISGVVIPQSTSIQVWGWVVDGDKKFISLRGGYNATVATFQNYGMQYGRGGLSRGPGFAAGIQNVEIVYTAGFFGTPFDLEMLARKVCSLNYKRRSWIGQRTQMMASGAGTVSYNEWEMDQQDMRTLQYYQRRVA